MAEGREKDIGSDSNLPVTSSEILRREKQRLEASLLELEKTLHEIEIEEKRSKMASNVVEPRDISKSSSQPFLGFSPQAPRAFKSGTTGILKAAQKDIGAEKGEYNPPLTFKLASSMPTKPNLTTRNSSEENETFSLSNQRGELFAVDDGQQVIQNNGLVSTSLGGQLNSLSDWWQRPLRSLTDRSSNLWSGDSRDGEQNVNEDLMNLARFEHGNQNVDKDDWGSTRVELLYTPLMQSTGLLPRKETNLSPIAEENVPRSSQNQRDSWGSTKVELQYTPNHYTDDNNQRRSVHFNQDERQYGQTNLGFQGVRRKSTSQQFLENEGINGNYSETYDLRKRQGVRNDPISSNEWEHGYEQFRNTQGRQNIDTHFAHSTPKNYYDQRHRHCQFTQGCQNTDTSSAHSIPKNHYDQRHGCDQFRNNHGQSTIPDSVFQSRMPNLVNQSSVPNFNQASSTPSFGHSSTQNPSQQHEYNNIDIMTKLVARQVIGKELPNFYGNPEDWPLFQSQYIRTTETCHFSGEENVFRLRKCLKGEALESVRSLLVSPYNSGAIMQILQRRFGRPDDIIKSLVKKVKEIAAPREDKPRSIIAFATIVQNLVATLENLGREDHLRNPILLDDLENKLPTTLCLLWSEYAVDRHNVTLREFANWMQRRAEAASRRFTLKPDRIEDSKKGNNQVKQNVYNMKEVVEPKVSTNKRCGICSGSCRRPDCCELLLKKNLNQRWCFAKEKKLCFSCLSADHDFKKCPKQTQCGIDGCTRTHNKVLHYKPDGEQSNPNNTNKQISIAMTNVQTPNRTNLRILPVILSNNGQEIRSYALLDNGSQSTLISADLVQRLNITGISNPIVLQWPNGDVSAENDSQIVKMSIRGTFDGAKTYMLQDVQTTKNLNLMRQTINREELITKWPYLRNIAFEGFENVRPEILIGENNGLLTATRQLLHDVRNTPIASKTWLGWTISGNNGKPTQSGSVSVFTLMKMTDEDLHNLVKSSFAIDETGVKEQTMRSKEDLKAQKILEATTRNVGSRWQTGLLWRNPNVILPESRLNAYHRLLNLEKKLDKNPELHRQYEDIVNGYIEKKYLRKVIERNENGQRSWYLPHFPVLNPMKPGKIRMAFDAAAKSKGCSLNDYLVTGPNLLKPLPGILFRFRQGTIGFIGDIKEMFHRVLIKESDVKCQKILWRGRKRDVEPDEYEMTVMMFGATCSPCSASYVKNLNAKQFEDKFPEAVDAIINKHYMDDYLDSKFSVEEAIKIIKEVIYIHQQGSFEIRNWISSSKDVMEAIPEQLRGNFNSGVTLDHVKLPGRVLGILWKPEEDVFTFSADFAKIDKDLLDGGRLPTKREVLKIVNSIYDPLGFVAHFIVTGKIILKNIWKSKIGWDETIPKQIIQDWLLFLRNLKNIGDVQIDRCYSSHIQTCDNIQLHVFGDSSNQAYCAVAYIRIQCGQEVHVKLVTAKTRVTPLKEVTDENIHRMELQAALLVSRLSKFVSAEHEVNINECYYWTDSMAVWYWIHSETKRYKQFVANRLNEILELTDSKNWKWLPSDMNVADEGTRFGPVNFSKSSQWYNGPSFLYENQSKWPEPKDKRILTEIKDWMEVVNVVQVVKIIEFALPKVKRFSKWRRLIGATAWMFRYLNNCNPNRPNILSENLSIEEWSNAEMKWILNSQQRCFGKEIADLTKHNVVDTKSRIFNLTPQLDENGILRLCGRADRLPNSVIDQRRPIILDGKDEYVRLLMRFYHEHYNHIGHETVLNEVKQRFWIVQASIVLKKIRAECYMCKLLKSKPHTTIMGQLPAARLTGGNPAFYYTGIDYFGPISIKIGRQIHKRYGVLFTCLTVRAVHIEIASSLTTDSCIMAIRRFIARRGCPKEVFSDNGTNLRGAEKELKANLQAIDQDKIRSAMTTHRIQWNFNPPAAPHMSGIWERLVRTIKTSFYATLNTVHPTEEMLSTLMAEAEHVVNSRPLLEISNHPDEPETLTPNHFLIGRSSASAPIGNFDSNDLILKKQWRSAQYLADLFWKRWLKEFCPTLTQRTKWFRKGRNPRIGEVVLIADPNEPRGNWPRGIITAVYPGIDDVIRVVDVRTNNGTYRRPMAKICLLDLD